MVRFAIIGFGNMSMRLKVFLMLHSIQAEVAVDSESEKNRQQVMEMEPELLLKNIYVNNVDSESRITIEDLRSHAETFIKAIDKESMELKIVPRNIPIPAQCKRAAKIQTTWIRRK